MSTMISTPEGIELYRLHALKGAIRLEMVGLKRRGQSACARVKEELGIPKNASRQHTLDSLLRHIEQVEKHYDIKPVTNTIPATENATGRSKGQGE